MSLYTSMSGWMGANAKLAYHIMVFQRAGLDQILALVDLLGQGGQQESRKQEVATQVEVHGGGSSGLVLTSPPLPPFIQVELFVHLSSHSKHDWGARLHGLLPRTVSCLFSTQQ